ncbi:NupC family nucleoside transporter [Allomyces macrogynus ATCC 38327]|uniref:NupC family nucleoside transporter n=1 Tax=Allomyces macrogynus (strain ATCC 38327) TaxID=578462 RepID=A0A0L0SP29_ALLM3|nr:NupC family nucleoside transporter [Allomyces macrogynus ATCC 38327]KNE73327.1 NupC family nucleoside transporter [Allomyces macrogynus ATCC 38327]|eukprot:KNE64125.1 NupC family nucleoside transporter [Allomyces macrogynus ATCC 38327]
MSAEDSKPDLPKSASDVAVDKAVPGEEPAANDSMLRKGVDALICILLTVWLGFAWSNHPEKIAFPAFLYFCIVLKIATKRIDNATLIKPFSLVLTPIGAAFNKLPALVRHGLIAAIICIIAIVSIATADDNSPNGTRLQRAQSLIGQVVILGLLVLFSRHRKHINPYLVLVGILLQYLLGLIVLKTWIGKTVFQYMATLVGDFLGLGKAAGLSFLAPELDKVFDFATAVLPAIIFFCSFIQIVYYFGGMQWLVAKFAFIMMRVMDTSGAESVVAAASPFVGQGESALLIKPFLEFMTEAEIVSIMVSGFATVSGSVLSAYYAYGADGASILSSCIMSVPCSLALAKLYLPETETSLSKGEVQIPESNEEKEANVLHAAANGASQGIHLAALIMATLLSLISLFKLCDIVFTEFFSYLNPASPINIERVLSYLFYPFAWIMGVPSNECFTIGKLLGKKIVLNEMVAYADLGALMKANEISTRASTIATYALCGFANVGSVGIQIGILGALAPTRRADVARLAVPAMLVGTLCTFFSASIAGIFI